jgi:hypothetical protein
MMEPINKSAQVAKSLLESQRMQDVHLLLEHLFEQEEATVKMVLGCLYDVGSENLLDKKLRPIKGAIAPVARLSKPAFRFFAVRWFKKNCPKLITDWLFTLVEFNNTDPAIAPATLERSELIAQVETYGQEIEALHAQVKWLKGVAIASVATLSGTAIWLGYTLNSPSSPPLQPPSSATKPISTSNF